VAVVAVACIAGGAGAGSAEAARQPTLKEREALTLALPASFRRIPVGCVWLRMSVSSNGRFAKVEPVFLNATRAPCVQYASNGFWILKKVTRWRIVYNGSEPPLCSLGVPRDLTRCRQ
jgi:hypothetical protein